MKKIFLALVGLIAFCNLSNAQNDTMYVMKAGIVVSKRAIADIDSIVFYTHVVVDTIPNCGIVTDADGNTYNTVLIGTQCWMRENLRVGTMIDGSVNQTNNGIIEKHCYGNNPVNCNTYGGLYQWNELMQGGAQGICPTGWHIPEPLDYDNLSYNVGDSAGGKLKTTGTIEGGNGFWYAPNTMATNSSGFSALPGGWKDEYGNFANLGYVAFFFTSQTWWGLGAYFKRLDYDYGYFYLQPIYTNNNSSLSVRCLKD